jgi:hypothetical protein
MKRTKALRRRCDLPACGKLYRYSDPRSRTCSSRCRQRLYIARKKATAQVAEEQLEAERQAKASRMAARMMARTEADMMDSRSRQSAPAPRPPTATPPPAPTPWPYANIRKPEPLPQTVTIRYRKPYTTPL